MQSLIIKSIFPELSREHSATLLPDLLSEIHIGTFPGLICNRGEELQIEFSKDGSPVRKVNNRSNFRVTGFLPSNKNGNIQPYESPIELSGLLYLEASPIVKSYQVQPAYIGYILDGKRHTHVPDVIAELVNGQMVFIEFKDIGYLNDSHLVSRSEHLRRTLPAYGYSYFVVIPDQMPAILQANCEELTRKAVKKFSAETRENIRAVMTRLGMVSLKSLLDILSPLKISKGELFALICRGDIQINWVMPLTNESLLIWKEQA
ncbi:MAG TPA: hypothetical protein VK974_01180 [Methylophilaceae bacterium]|nr:hypothetical protein [Methylophilaceae bacterium]